MSFILTPSLPAYGPSGNVLTSNGSGWVSSTPAPQSFNLISTKTASGTSVEFTGLSGYKSYQLIFGDLAYSTSNLYVQVGTGLTPTYLTSGYGYAGFEAISPNPLAGTGWGGDNLSYIEISANVSTTNYGAFGSIIFENMDANINAPTTYCGEFGYARQPTLLAFITSRTINGMINNNSQKTAIKMELNAGTFSSGYVSLYGISS